LKRFSSHAHLLQWIDRRVGVPVCFLLTMVRRLGGWFGRRGPAAPGRSVLFLKLAEQGSTVLAHEAIRTAVARVGRENVHFLVFEENRFIVDLLGLIPPENVLTVRTQSAWSMAVSCGRRLIEIRRRRLDTCIDLEFFSRFSAAIGYLTGASRRVGFHAFFGEGPDRGDLLTHRVLYNPHLPTSQTFTSLVLALAADPEQLPTLAIVTPPSPALPWFRPAPEELLGMRRLIGSLGVPATDRLILLNANAGDLLPLRKWDETNYLSLAGRLLQEFPGLAVAFTGSPEEAPRIEELVRAVGSPRCVCLAGRTTLRQLVVVYGLAEVLVTNDSGPAHFAALTEIDVVSLFGPETPLLFAAPGPRSHPLCAGLACSPCLNAFNNRQTACRDNVCMQRITVDQVFEAVCRIYRQRTGKTSAPTTADTPTR
jgi:ADP-heptose:LPS heptosyltransferase